MLIFISTPLATNQLLYLPTMSANYLVIIEKTDTGHCAYVPDLLGCIAVGDTLEETQANMQEAISLHVAGMQEDGIEIPAAHTQAVTMTIARGV